MILRRVTLFVLPLLLTVIFITGCSKVEDNDVVQNLKSKDTIKIGLVTPLSGDVSTLGSLVGAGAEVAEDEINKLGGVGGRQLEIIYEDGLCEAKTANLAGSKLINVDKVEVIIGGVCSGETLAIAPLAEESGVVLLSPGSTNPDVTNAGDYVFRLIASDHFQGKFVANYIKKDLNKNKVAILYLNDSDWSVGVKSVFAKKFKELGGKVVADESMAADERDLRAQIVKIMAGEPELVYFPSHPEAGSIGIRQIREMGLSVPILGGDMWDEGMLQKIGKIAEGVQFTVTAEATLPTQFLNAVRDKLGNDEMNVYGPRAYDAVKILASIINKVGYDADKIKAELYKIKNYHGIADTYTIDKNGDVSSASYDVKEFRNGKLSTVN